MSEQLLTALRQSTPEERRVAFAELARELFREQGHGPVTIQDEQKRTVGYIIDELDESALPFPKLTAAETAELRRRAENRGEALEPEAFITELDRELRART